MLGRIISEPVTYYINWERAYEVIIIFITILRIEHLQPRRGCRRSWSCECCSGTLHTYKQLDNDSLPISDARDVGRMLLIGLPLWLPHPLVHKNARNQNNDQNCVGRSEPPEAATRLVEIHDRSAVEWLTSFRRLDPSEPKMIHIGEKCDIELPQIHESK